MALCFERWMLQQLQIYITCTAVCGIGGAQRTAQVSVGSDDGFPSEQLLLLIDTPESSFRSPQALILLRSLHPSTALSYHHLSFTKLQPQLDAKIVDPSSCTR